MISLFRAAGAWSVLMACCTAGVGAAGVRELPPLNHSLLPGGTASTAGDDTKSAAALKPAGSGVPSPILVDRSIDIGADGSVRFGCDDRGRRNFQTIAREARQ